MAWQDFTLRVLLALTLGGLIGAERQMRQRMAGLRTNALVAIGASLFVMLSQFQTDDPAGAMRIASYVVSGIGFLGAGVIMREGGSVRGLNTAATLWCSAAVGVFCGLGHPLEAAIGAGAILGTNVLLRGVSHFLDSRGLHTATEVEQVYRLSIICRPDDEVSVRTLILNMLNSMPHLIVQSLHSEDMPSGNQLEVRADLIMSPSNHSQLEQIVSRVSLEPGVSSARWAVLSDIEI